MATIYNTSIVTDGLVLYVDAANPRSWTGSGSTWFDLSPSGNNMTLVGSPTKGSNNGGVVQFSAVQYAYNAINLTTLPHTIMGSARYSASTNSRIISAYANNWLLGHWSSTTQNYYAEGWVSTVRASPTDTNWRIHAGTGHATTDIWTSYVNGTQTFSGSGGSAGPNGLQLNGYNAFTSLSEVSVSEVGFLMAYNRVLTAAEIQQNYNAMRSRYSV